MRSLLVPSSYAPHVGGVEEVTARLAEQFAARGVPAAVVTNHWPRSLPGTETIDAVRVVRHPFRVPQRSVRGVVGWALGSEATKRAVVADARAHGSEVVNLHCVSSNAEYALAAAVRTSLPLVVSLHGELGNDAADAYARDRRLRRSWRRVVAAADAVTAPSSFVLEQAERFYGAPLGDRATVIRNGVDLAHFDRPRGTGARPFVLALGRLVRPKGFDVLIDAWSRLPTDLDVELVIAGDGPERERLQARAAGRRIRFVGRLDRDGVATHLSTAALFVLPSHAEPLGLAVLEAMAARTPVVATHAGGVPELVVDGTTGLLVGPADPAAMATRILDVLHDPVGAAGRADAAAAAVSSMTWSACADAYLEVYRRAGNRT